jgi:RNA polymerase sigma-70 factor, ECF subfamily
MSVLAKFFQLSDEQAMWRVQMHDDGEAFAQLVGRWQGAIHRLCTRMLSDEHKAKDLTQEVFSRLYLRRQQYHQEGRFSTFLWRIAVNLCLDEIRRIKRRRECFTAFSGQESPSLEVEDEVGTIMGPDQELVTSETTLLVQKALQSLPEHYRSVVILRHYEGLKFREIGEILGIPVGTVKSRMAEGLNLLHQALSSSLERQPERSAKPSILKCL